MSKHSQAASSSSPTLGGKPLRPQLIRSPPPPTLLILCSCIFSRRGFPVQTSVCKCVRPKVSLELYLSLSHRPLCNTGTSTPHRVIPMIRPPWRSLHAVCGTFNGILCGWLDSPHTTRMNSPHGQRVHVQLPADATVTDLHFPRHLNFNHHAKN